MNSNKLIGPLGRMGVVALLWVICSPAPGAECQLVNRATLPVVEHSGGPVVNGTLNGHDILVRIDTGLSLSMLSLTAARRGGHRPMQSTSHANLRFVGVKGGPTLRTVTIDNMKIADFAVERTRWLVFPGSFSEEVDVVIGADVLSRFDLEIALQNRQVILWHARDCENAPLAYWTTDYMTAHLREELGPFGMEVEVDGKRMPAALASGTRRTVMNLGMATSLGFSPPSGETNDRHLYGLNGERATAYEAMFGEFHLGELTVKNPRFLIANLHRYSHVLEHAYRGDPAEGRRNLQELTTHVGETGARFVRRTPVFLDLVLGEDFLRANRVLIANSQGLIYFTYTGGRVFGERPDPSASEPEGVTDSGPAPR